MSPTASTNGDFLSTAEIRINVVLPRWFGEEEMFSAVGVYVRNMKVIKQMCMTSGTTEPQKHHFTSKHKIETRNRIMQPRFEKNLLI